MEFIVEEFTDNMEEENHKDCGGVDLGVMAEEILTYIVVEKMARCGRRDHARGDLGIVVKAIVVIVMEEVARIV